MIGGRRITGIDGALYRLLHRRLRARPLDPVMVAFTRLGSKNAIWLVISGCLFLWGDRKAKRVALVSLGGTLTAQTLSNILLKPLFRRERPFRKGRNRSLLLVQAPKEHSWPSAHAASSAAALVIVGGRYPRSIPPLLVLALLVSYSRIYVGVHYPFDVAAGATIGVGVGGCWLLSSSLVDDEG